MFVLVSCKKTSDDAKTIDISGYTIIRSDNAGEELSAFVTTFKQLIKTYSGADLQVSGDFAEDSGK